MTVPEVPMRNKTLFISLLMMLILLASCATNGAPGSDYKSERAAA